MVMNLLAMLFLQESGEVAPPSSAAMTGIMIAYAAIILLMIAAMWKVFSKAGEPGWAAIIPIYNLYVLCKIAGKPGWWVILMFIPVVNFIIAILLVLGIAQNFGKGTGFAMGLLFLSPIFYPILAWGDARYQKA
jgi:hypothetical protein